jgi:hypothetical protein
MQQPTQSCKAPYVLTEDILSHNGSAESREMFGNLARPFFLRIDIKKCGVRQWKFSQKRKNMEGVMYGCRLDV